MRKNFKKEENSDKEYEEIVIPKIVMEFGL